MRKKRKWLMVLALGVAAAAQYSGGGIWTYGDSNGGDFPNYYHFRNIIVQL